MPPAGAIAHATKPPHTRLMIDWFDAVILLLFVIATVVALDRRLPLQNILTAAFTVAMLSLLVELLSLKLPIPHREYTPNAGPRLFHLVSWISPLLSLVLILNSRGVAQLILLPWRRRPNPGLRTLALAATLAVILELGLEPFAVDVARLWTWTVAHPAPVWYSAPWLNLFLFGIIALIALILATPWLINKAATTAPPPNSRPLVLWLALALLLAIANFLHGLLAAAIFGLFSTSLITLLALLGSRSPQQPPTNH